LSRHRDLARTCKAPGDPGEKTARWPAPEILQNLNKKIGNLGLSEKEEDQIVAFLQTLTDGYKP
jgi:hypothetical protein